MSSQRSRSSLLSVLFSLLSVFCLMLAVNSGAAPAQAQAPMPASASPSADDEGVLVLRLHYASTGEYIALAEELGLEEGHSPRGYFSFPADRATYDDLKARGKQVEIDEAATKEARANPVVFGHNADTFFNGYYTVEEMQTFLDQKVAQYPTLTEKVDYGDSWCKLHPGQCTQPDNYNGYDMYAMRITNHNTPGPKPVFWFNTGLHPREIVPPELAIRYISWLLDNYNTNADARWIVDWHEIWIVPMSNPDGHHIVENGNSTPRTQRKNADKDDGCTTYPPTGTNQFGTDLNRNFSFKWNCCGGSSGLPCNLTYRGPSPASEPETQAITARRDSLIADQRGPNDNDAAPITTTGVFVDMHSNAELTLYPWGQTFDPAPNAADLRNIAKHMSAPSVGGNGYHMEQSVGLYPTDGASDDAAYGDLGAAAFTVELASGGSFTPPYSVVNIDWNANRGLLIYLSKISRMPYLMNRGPDANTIAAVPMTVTQGSSVTLSGTINYNWAHTDPVEPNTYLQNVAAAEYYIDTPPWAGGTAIPMQAADGGYNSATEAVQATVDTTGLTPGRHILLVRGRGVNDYEGHQSWGPISATFIDVLPSGGTVTPTASPTIGPPCGALPVQPALTSCQLAPNVYSYSFTFYNESGCTQPATGNATLGFYVSNDPLGTFTLFDTDVISVTFPAGPSNVTFTGTMTETGIPANNFFYKIDFSASSVRAGAYNITGVSSLCPQGSVTPNPTITPGTTTPEPSITTTVEPSVTTTTTTEPSITPTVCTLQFTDVEPGSTFYENIMCLACRGIINGYTTGCETGNPCFRPGNLVTRGQLAKIVANAAGFVEPVGSQQFEDVPVGSTFFEFVWRLADREIVTGYPCGGVGEPCGDPALPYFRPNNNVTRGQISKIVSEAAGLSQTPTGQQFEDVPEGSTFYVWIWRLVDEGVMNGYPCGGLGEPCGDPALPYFRPGANATRGQASKIVANTFFPECSTPR